MCDHTRFIGLRAVDAHNQPVLGPNGIRATCATCSCRFGGAAHRGRAWLRHSRLGGERGFACLTPCPQSARGVSSAPPPASPGSTRGWHGQRSRPRRPQWALPAAVSAGAQVRSQTPPVQEKAHRWGMSGAQGGEFARSFAAPLSITAHAVARCRAKGSSPAHCAGELDARAPSWAALLLLAGRRVRAPSPFPAKRRACLQPPAGTWKRLRGDGHAAAREGRSVRAAAGGCQSHTCARVWGPRLGKGNRALMVSTLMPSAGAIYSR